MTILLAEMGTWFSGQEAELGMSRFAGGIRDAPQGVSHAHLLELEISNFRISQKKYIFLKSFIGIYNGTVVATSKCGT